MSSLKAQEKNAKVVFSLESPFTELSSPQWPYVSPQGQHDIGNLLYSFLESSSEIPDEDKGDKQEKQAGHPEETKKEKNKKKRLGGSLSPYLLVGPNAVTSHLESCAKRRTPSSFPSHMKGRSRDAASQGDQAGTTTVPKLIAVFVTRLDGQPTLLHAHLPILCALASVPLIQLPKGAEARLAKILGTQRVGFLGVLRDAPGAEVLHCTIREESLGFLERPGWLDGSSIANFSETKVK